MVSPTTVARKGQEGEQDRLLEEDPGRRALAQQDQAGEGGADEERSEEEEEDEGEEADSKGRFRRDVPDLVERLFDGG